MSAWPISQKTFLLLKKEEEQTGKSLQTIHEEIMKTFVEKMDGTSISCPRCKGNGKFVVALDKEPVWKQFEAIANLVGCSISVLFNQAAEDYCKQDLKEVFADYPI